MTVSIRELRLIGISGLPMVRPGDDLVALICARIDQLGIDLADGDALVIAQKIVSKAEGRLVRLEDVAPSAEARALGAKTGKDPRLVELILSESARVIRVRDNLLIVEHRLGFVCANAGVDRSNVEQDAAGEWVTLLPADPDGSARRLHETIRARTGRSVAVVINDSHGRAFRNGTVGVAIGLAGMPALSDRRGDPDLFGYQLQATVIGLADELAAAASLVMGQTDEAIPVVLARGLAFQGDGSGRELNRERELDLFR